MSFEEEIYHLTLGAMVEIQLEETTLRGEFDLILHDEVGRNPKLDQVQLENPVELPSEKRRNGRVSFPVTDIVNLKVIEFGVFGKKKRDYEYDIPSSTPLQSSKGGRGGRGISKKDIMRDPELKDLEPVEIMMRTVVIKDEQNLKKLMKLLKEVEVCGMSFEGENIGRHGVLSWIIMTAGKTLMPIDMIALSESMPNVWKTLEKDIFKNQKLVKIFHDSRPVSDYLLHVRGIEVVNVFDTQVADAIVSFDRSMSAPSQLNPLSDLLQLYNRRIPIGEIDFLRKYEDCSAKPVLVNSREFSKLCALKVKHLVPLRENLMKELLKKLADCTTTHMDSYRRQSKEAYSEMTKDSRDISKELVSKIQEGLKF